MAIVTNTHLEISESRSVGEILHALVRDVQRVIRDEVQLARSEFSEKAQRLRSAGGALAAAALCALFGAACIVAACIAALALIMAVWLAAAVMAILLGAAAWFAYAAGSRKLKQVDLTPHLTVETLRQDVNWVKQQAH